MIEEYSCRIDIIKKKKNSKNYLIFSLYIRTILFDLSSERGESITKMAANYEVARPSNKVVPRTKE